MLTFTGISIDCNIFFSYAIFLTLDDKLSEATITENESLGLDHVEKKEKPKPQPANPEVEAPITISG